MRHPRRGICPRRGSGWRKKHSTPDWESSAAFPFSGTTGIVRPMSHEAYIATIEKSMDVARASGLTHLVLTTGRRSERFGQNRWPSLADEAFIQIGDFFQASMAAAAKRGFSSATLADLFRQGGKDGPEHPPHPRGKIRTDPENPCPMDPCAYRQTGELAEQIAAVQHRPACLRPAQKKAPCR
jgi:hypothetical protein